MYFKMITFLPKTTLGKWSLGLLIAFFLCFVALHLLARSGQRGGDGFLDNLFLFIPTVLAGLAGVSAFLTGLISILKSKEHSILVFVATLIGFCIFIFVLGEILYPH